MYHQRESGILFFLSIILPIDICYGILNMMKTVELEDARQDYMEYMDNKTITDTDDTISNDSVESDIMIHHIRQLLRYNFHGSECIYRNINSTEQTRKNIGKIQRLSGTGSGWSSGSVTNEANSELAEKTASQIMLDRAITDRVERKYINYINTYNDIIINNINYEIKTSDKYYKKEHKNSVKKKMKNNKPPRIEKAFMNKSFRNKCR